MKRISSAAVTFAVLATVLGLVAAYVVRLSMQPPVAAPEPEPPGVRVVLARVNLAKHEQIRADDLQTIVIPADREAPEGAMRRSEVAVGRIVKNPVKAGQVMREEMLLGIGETLPGLAERIPAGHRAVTIAVEGAAPGGRRVEEGAYVDIAMTVSGDHPDLGELATRTLLRRVLVVDAAPGRNSRRAERMDDTITVAVIPKDANKLINAQRAGTLNVTLCSAADDAQPTGDDDITRRQLLGLRELPEPPAPPEPVIHRIEQWTGSEMKVLELSEERIREAKASTASAAHPAAAETSVVRPQFGGDVFVSGSAGNIDN